MDFLGFFIKYVLPTLTILGLAYQLKLERNKVQSQIYVEASYDTDSPFVRALHEKMDLPEIIDDYSLDSLRTIPYKMGLPSPVFMEVTYPISDADLKEQLTVGHLNIHVKNPLDIPSSNIRLVLMLKVYGSKVSYPIEDKIFNELLPRELFDIHPIEIPISFIKGNGHLIFSICELNGQFREVELVLVENSSNGIEHIKHSRFKRLFSLKNDKEILLYHYKHPVLKKGDISLIEDKELKNFYGLTNDFE